MEPESCLTVALSPFAFGFNCVVGKGLAGCVHATGNIRKSGQLSGVITFHHVGPIDKTQVVGLGGKCRYPLSPLTSPRDDLVILHIIQMEYS